MPSGFPTWAKLLAKVQKRFDSDIRNAIKRSGRFEKAMEHDDFIAAASALETAAGKERYTMEFRAELHGDRQPNRITRILADWPFEGYITTNYDDLIERALVDLKQPAWLSVGNTDTEIKKVARDPEKLIWHVHGYLKHTAAKSRLISTKNDYTFLYGAGSAYSDQLKGFLVSKRLVFLGFGFADQELLTTLKAVGKLTPVTRPILAILPNSIDPAERDELFRRYNVDSILYDPANDHAQLHDLLALHNPFILRRTQEYGRAHATIESYDEETTGLLIYNELTLKRRATPDSEVISKLLQSKVLARVSTQSCTVEALIKELNQLAEDVNAPGISLPAQEAAKAIQSLKDHGEIVVAQDGMVALTPQGGDFVRGQRAVAERERERLSASLFARVATHASSLTEAQKRRIAHIAENFFYDSIRKRAIGVASALYSDRYQDFSLTTLLQSLLPTFTQQSASLEEAGPLLATIRDVVLSPTDDERRVLGLMLQAQFAVHLLGQDLATVRLRLDELKCTLFILDSHALMPFLAKSAPGHEAMHTLITHLKELESFVTTTNAFLDEVRGHIRNAAKDQKGKSPQNFENFRNATGRGENTNVFTAGFYRELAEGNAGRGFLYYIQQVCNIPFGKPGVSATKGLIDRLGADGIRVHNLQAFTGYDREIAEAVVTDAARLTTRRQSDDTYKGTWQTDAEAEALAIVRYVRSGRVAPPERSGIKYAFFISPTRIVSQVSSERRVTIKIEALLQTIAVLTAWSLDEMKVLADAIFAEVSDHNLVVLQPEMVQHVFHPLEVSSKRQMAVVRAEYRDLLAARYGRDEIDRALAYDGADGILMAERLTTQALDVMADRNKLLERKLQDGKSASLNAKERIEFERLKNRNLEKRRRQAAKRSKARKRGATELPEDV